MKFSLIRTEKSGQTHLTLQTPEWFMNRILTDMKTCSIARLRSRVPYVDNIENTPQIEKYLRVCPMAELKKTENGRLEVAAFNGLIWLHVAGLLRPEDIEAVKEASKILPTTFAAFKGADGRSVEILVSVTPKSGVKLQTETEMTTFCQSAYELASGIYYGILHKPVERKAVSVRDSFLITLDEQPYFNPNATPVLVTDRQQVPGIQPDNKQERHEQLYADTNLYGDYELMYDQAAELARSDKDNINEPEQFKAYLTGLAYWLCQKGMPEEEAFLHIRNHHVYRENYNEYMFRAIVTSVYAEGKSKHKNEAKMVSVETRQLIEFLNTRYAFRFNKVMGYTEYRPNNTWVQDWQPCDKNVINGMALQA